MNPLRVYRIYRAVFDWIAGLEAIRLFKILNRDQRNTFVACFLGWALDALDFFLVTFVLVPLGHDFGQTIPKVAFAITLTLMMRPVGAFIFGILGDKFGRRIPLMADIIFYSVMELLTAFAPNFTVFLILRALFGIGMGGEWGLGASLAMESLPTQARGLFSGILQQGYAAGYLVDRKSTRLNSSHEWISYAVFCLKKKKKNSKRLATTEEVAQRKLLGCSQERPDAMA